MGILDNLGATGDVNYPNGTRRKRCVHTVMVRPAPQKLCKSNKRLSHCAVDTFLLDGFGGMVDHAAQIDRKLQPEAEFHICCALLVGSRHDLRHSMVPDRSTAARAIPLSEHKVPAALAGQAVHCDEGVLYHE